MKKIKYSNTAAGTTFTTLYFLLNLPMGPISWTIIYRLERLANEKHSRLLSPFISYEENEVFKYCSRDHIHNTSFSS
jgi:hypothetical protein